MKRIDSIDALRAFSIAFMVQCHFTIFLSSGQGSEAEKWAHFFMNHILGDLGAPWFLLLVGMSQVISARKRQDEGAERIGAYRVLVRGLFLFALGCLFCAAVYGPSHMFAWDILTLIGFGTILLLPCRRLPSWAILTACALIWAASPYLRSMVDFEQYWGGKLVPVDTITRYIPNILFDPPADFQPKWGIWEIINGFLLVGYFPVFPWIIYPLIGFVLGRRLVAGQLAHDMPFYFIIGLLFTALGLGDAIAGSAASGYSPITGYVAPLSFYPNSASMVLYQTGIMFIVFTIFYLIFDSKPRDAAAPAGIILTYFRRVSRYSLTLYVGHYLCIFWPLRAIYFITGKFYYEAGLNAFLAIGIALSIVAAFYPLLGYWDKKKSKYSFEWILNWCTEAAIKSFSPKN